MKLHTQSPEYYAAKYDIIELHEAVERVERLMASAKRKRNYPQYKLYVEDRELLHKALEIIRTDASVPPWVVE
jgi:hypothetical protein